MRASLGQGPTGLIASPILSLPLLGLHQRVEKEGTGDEPSRLSKPSQYLLSLAYSSATNASLHLITHLSREKVPKEIRTPKMEKLIAKFRECVVGQRRWVWQVASKSLCSGLAGVWITP